MIFNIISIVSFIVILALNIALKKFKYSTIIVKVLSLTLFIYKSLHYIIQNLRGNLSIPVEISSISYFIIPIILIFKIKKLYSVASFFGIASGLGFFLFYCFLGFTVSDSFTIVDLLISTFAHGCLLTAGLQLMFKNHFENKTHKIWITMLSIICWAMAFYELSNSGITFVYYIIKPSYLYLFSSAVLNFLLTILFYALIVTLFYFSIKLFFYINAKIHKCVITHNKLEEESFSNNGEDARGIIDFI